MLKFAYLKGGAEGHPWALAVGTLNDLLWSIKPKEDTEERKKLAALLPELLRRVKAYLDRVEVDAGTPDAVHERPGRSPSGADQGWAARFEIPIAGARSR